MNTKQFAKEILDLAHKTAADHFFSTGEDVLTEGIVGDVFTNQVYVQLFVVNLEETYVLGPVKLYNGKIWNEEFQTSNRSEAVAALASALEFVPGR